MNRKAIQGDPATIVNPKGHLTIEWVDRTVSSRLKGYKNDSQINEHADEAFGWTEQLERIVIPNENADLSVRWFEYRGKNCSETKKPPLVISFFEYFNTCWQRIADREGLVIAAFEYHRNSRIPKGGLGALGFGPRPDEIVTYHEAVSRVIRKYNCDEERIYLSGLSYGDLSAMLYAQRYGHELAAMINLNGPSSAYNLERYGLLENMPAIPALQIRSDDDFSCDGFPAGPTFEMEGNLDWIRYARSNVVMNNRRIWLRSNGIGPDTMPEIGVCGNKMFARYPSAKGDEVFVEFHKKGHIVPIDTAELMWDFFSRYKRNPDGSTSEMKAAPKADKKLLCMAAGYDRAFLGGKVINLPANCLILDPEPVVTPFVATYNNSECSYSSFYAPVEILKDYFGIDYTVSLLDSRSVYAVSEKENPALDLTDGSIFFDYKGSHFELVINTCECIADGFTRDMERMPLNIYGQLMIPVKETAELLGYYSTEINDTICVCDHPFEMGFVFSRIIREELLFGGIKTRTASVSLTVNGEGTVSEVPEIVEEGTTLKLHICPADGKAAALYAYMNGQRVLTNYIEDDLYYICNCFGEVEIQVDFE